MDPITELRRLGGVAQVRALLDAGVTTHALRMAKTAGTVRKIRNGWVALPDADPILVGAARRGVVLTCVTLAKRHNLWVRKVSELHVGAPPTAGHVTAPKAVVHWNKPVVPRMPGAVEDLLINALVIATACLVREDAIALWESALRKGVVQKSEVLRLPLAASARSLVTQASLWSDSGLESIVLHRLRWLKLPLVQQAWVLGHWVDLLIGDRLVIQIDGGTHVGAQRTEDIAHDALLKLHGYHVIRIGYDQIMNHWTEVQARIMSAIAQGLHLA
jgi:very-short-patch-repair endonuclease